MKHRAIALTCLLVLCAVEACKKDGQSAGKSPPPGPNETSLSLRFSSLKEEYNIRTLSRLELEIVNHNHSEEIISPWYFDYHYYKNAELFIRLAGTNGEWTLCNYRAVRGSNVFISRIGIGCQMVIPSRGKMTFWMTAFPKSYPPGEYEVYAALKEMPEVKTEKRIIEVVKKPVSLKKRWQNFVRGLKNWLN